MTAHLVAARGPLLGQLRLIPPPARFRPIQRRPRAPFRPSAEAGPYRLPIAIAERLEADLVPFRNREAALALARFLARFWTAPGRLSMAFPVDRRALADHADLGLTEARVRGALATLERIGFLNRLDPQGSTHRRTAAGGLWRKVVPHRIGLDFLPAFVEANRRAAKARARRPMPPARPISTPAPARSPLISPKSNAIGSRMLMGDVVPALPRPLAIPTPTNLFEAALARLGAAVQGRRGAA